MSLIMGCIEGEWQQKRKEDGTMRQKIALLLLLLFLPISFFAELRVHFLDVGQGDRTIGGFQSSLMF